MEDPFHSPYTPSWSDNYAEWNSPVRFKILMAVAITITAFCECDILRSGTRIPTFWGNLLPSSSRYMTRAAHSSEMSIHFYQIIHCYISKGRNLQDVLLIQHVLGVPSAMRLTTSKGLYEWSFSSQPEELQ